MCDVYREMSNWDATLYNIIRDIILNKNKTKTKKQKNKKTKKQKTHYVGSGPKVLSQLTRCVLYIER